MKVFRAQLRGVSDLSYVQTKQNLWLVLHGILQVSLFAKKEKGGRMSLLNINHMLSQHL